MLAEQKELYNFTKDHFITDLQKISKTCVSPLILIRQTVKKSIDKYIIDYCSNGTKPEEIFSHDDFLQVSETIYNDIMTDNL